MEHEGGELVDEDEPEWVEDYLDRLRTHKPRCLRACQFYRSSFDGKDTQFVSMYGGVACRCGGETGTVLGYPLKDLNRDYDGDDFMSPMAFECSQCGKTTELLDTDKHGYHSEVARIEGGSVGAAKLRGKGSRSRFECPGCSKTDAFRVQVRFVYWGAVLDLYDDEPDLPVENFFTEIVLSGECSGCGTTTQLTDFGGL